MDVIQQMPEGCLIYGVDAHMKTTNITYVYF